MKTYTKMLRTFILLLFLNILFSGWTLASDKDSLEPIAPLPLPKSSPEYFPEKVYLGKKLFSDTRLSGDNTISCNSCHNLNSGGVDNKVRSLGVGDAEGDINTPTIFNSGFNFRIFWNGRAKSLEEQIDGPVQNPKEMAGHWPDIIRKLKQDKDYTEAFDRVYKNDISRENIINAIAAFERTLVTPNSRIDQYLRGNKNILNEQEKRGYQNFKSYGCIACHQGMNIGGNMYQTMGVMGDYFKDRGTPITEADLGKYNVTKLEKDRHVFRVPSLRNVALTAPYFHDGSAKNLDAAVKIMAKYQLGRQLSQSEVDAIVAFLKTLTGEQPQVLQ